MNKIFTTILILIISVQNLLSQNISTIAGIGTAGYSGDAGLATAAELNQPLGMAKDASGNIYVAELNNHIIRKINTSGIITTIAGTGVSGFSGDGGPATSAQLNEPYAVAVDAAGNVYIADHGNYRIRMINTSGDISTFAGTGSAASNGDGGLATAAAIGSPTSVIVDANGNVIFASAFSHCVRKIDNVGHISTIAGTGVAGYNGDNISASTAQLNVPYGLALDASGNIYIAERDNRRIRKINSLNVISTIAGGGAYTYSDGYVAVNAKLSAPVLVEVDGYGNVYFIEESSSIVEKINAIGYIYRLAGTGNFAYSGDGGPAKSAELYFPGGLLINASGELLIGDRGNNRIRKVTTCTPPTAPTISATSTSICNGNGTDLSISSGDLNDPYANWIWYSGSCGGNYEGSNATFGAIPTTTTTYYVRAEGACINVPTCASITINVNNLPLPNVTISGNTNPCEGESVTLTASGTNSYSWFGGGPNTAAYTFTANNHQNYYSVMGIDANNCYSVASVSLTVKRSPQPRYNETQAPLCANDAAITLGLASPTGGTYSGNGVTGDSFDPSVAGAGTHTITYTVVGPNGCPGSDIGQIIVKALPTLSYVETQNNLRLDTPPFTLAAATPAGGTYSGNGVSGNTFDPATAGLGTHPVTYSYTDVNTGCSNSVVSNIQVSLTNGVNSSNAYSSSFDIYPNPANDKVNIECTNSNLIDGTEVHIYNMLGELVIVKSLTQPMNQVDIHEIPNGIYHYHFMRDNVEVKTGKLIVKK